MKEEFQLFLRKLCGQMAMGDSIVNIVGTQDKVIPVRVIGYDEYLMRVRIEFLSDSVTVKKLVRVERSSGWGFYDDTDNYNLVEKDVPIKDYWLSSREIKFNDEVVTPGIDA